MFSVWPELFAFELLGVTLLRVTVAYFFLLLGTRLLRAVWHTTLPRSWQKYLAIAYGLGHTGVGLLLLVGLYTQPTALAGAVLTMLPVGTGGRPNTCEQHLRLLLFTISLSLIFFGAGAFSFDVPL